MSTHDVIAVIGACAPARAAYAERLSAAAQFTLVSERTLTRSLDPLGTALRLAGATAGGSVVEFPLEADVTAVIGAFADSENRLRLTDIVCVADAVDIRADLLSGEFLWTADTHTASYTARALIVARQIEYASTVIVTGSRQRATAEILETMALLSHLNPQARVILDDGAGIPPRGTHSVSEVQDRSGWLQLLNHEFAPRITTPRVSGFLWENERPLHPGRLKSLLLGPWTGGRFGTVVRSAGLCRFATRPGIIGAWEQAGQTISLDPLAADDDHDDEFLAFGQSIGVIGIDLDDAALTAALDRVTLTTDELLAGPAHWLTFDDPFPAWEGEPEHRS